MAFAYSFSMILIEIQVCVPKPYVVLFVFFSHKGRMSEQHITMIIRPYWNLNLEWHLLPLFCGLFSISSQDTIRNPPSESKQMKKAAFLGIITTTFFYMSVAVAGYAAFGDSAPGNLLTGFPTPFWLVDFANTCVVIHLIGAYQVPYTTQCFLNQYTYVFYA